MIDTNLASIEGAILLVEKELNKTEASLSISVKSIVDFTFVRIPALTKDVQDLFINEPWVDKEVKHALSARKFLGFMVTRRYANSLNYVRLSFACYLFKLQEKNSQSTISNLVKAKRNYKQYLEDLLTIKSLITAGLPYDHLLEKFSKL